mgnify:CR=1 FL=1
MAIKNFFPKRPQIKPVIYGYKDLLDPNLKDWIKIGETIRDPEVRIKEQYPIKRPGAQPWETLFVESSIREDGSSFRDKDILNCLELNRFEVNGEFAKVTLNDLKGAYNSVKSGSEFDSRRTLAFSMRPEQEAAVNKTINFIKAIKKENPKEEGRFLWNAKMRFGKTFAAYQLAKRMKWKKVLVLTYQPVVQNAWEQDLMRHVDFKGWQFVTNDTITKQATIDSSKPLVCFGSFQDFLGKNSYGGIKSKNEWVHAKNWDCIIYDEYHYGAWNEKSKELTDNPDREEKSEANYLKGEGRDYFEKDLMPITGDFHLYLSGTPFRALTNGEFIEDQIFNWSYVDEQREKNNFIGDNNPYKTLPRINLLTYQLPAEIIEITQKGEFDQFNLSEFFYAEGEQDAAKFKYEDHVQKWLDFIRGNYSPRKYADLKINQFKAPVPFSDVNLLDSLTHTFWFLPSVSACFAMKNLLENKNNKFFKDYEIICAAGNKAGIGVKALKPVESAMKNPLDTKTITLTCRKLHSGVSVPPWTGIFMLRNLNSPEMYFQTAFRVQTPWTVKNSDISNTENEEIIKNECYIFDFAPNRALRQLSSYAIQIDPITERDDETKVQEFVNFLPVLAYEEGQLKLIDAAGILERAISGTSSTLLAKKWTSSELINVDDQVLSRVLGDQMAMNSLQRLEAFRNLNEEIEVIINSSKKIKEIKKAETQDDEKVKTQLTEEQKKYKAAREELADKFKKLASRIPIFMYLTDYRERTLQDVIKELEPGLFRKVTGLTEKEFDHLEGLGVFNASLMNAAVGDFKRCEDRSLSYTGIFKHEGLNVGLYETVISDEEFQNTF